MLVARVNRISRAAGEFFGWPVLLWRHFIMVMVDYHDHGMRR